MDAQLISALEQTLGCRIRSARAVSGGDINEAYRAQTDAGPVFVKAHRNGPPQMFDCEADGLTALRDGLEGTGVVVPAVLAQGRAGTSDYLALQWLEGGHSRPASSRVLGEGLAALHRVSSDSGFGWARANYIGSLPQKNGWNLSWPEFYGTRRLGDQANIGEQSGVLPTTVLADIERLRGRLDGLLPSSVESSLLHGDLWGGNKMFDESGTPILFDPAVYFGHREIELAFTHLFGGFERDFYAAYEATWPLLRGHEERVDLYNLYPLLVHANLFGGHYVGQVARTVRRYL